MKGKYHQQDSETILIAILLLLHKALRMHWPVLISDLLDLSSPVSLPDLLDLTACPSCTICPIVYHDIRFGCLSQAFFSIWIPSSL